MKSYKKSFEAFALENIPLIKPGDNIINIIIDSLKEMNEKLYENDIVIISSKIISKIENRYVDMRNIEVSDEAIELSQKVDKDPRIIQLILQESKVLAFTSTHMLTRNKHGFVTMNAGIDRHNIENTDSMDFALLFPEDADGSAFSIRRILEEYYNIKIGVIIQDSTSTLSRYGTVGMPIGSSGVKMLDRAYDEDDQKNKDLYGRTIQKSNRPFVNIGDQLSSVGNLLMGESSDSTPIVVIRGFNFFDESQESTNLVNSEIPIDLSVFSEEPND